MLYILKHISQIDKPVYVAEQLPCGNVSRLKLPANVKHVPCNIQQELFCKNYIIEQFISQINTTHLWVNDADCFLDYQKAINQFADEDYYQPFHTCKDLNETQTQQLVTQHQISSDMLHDNMSDDRRIRMYGAQSYIINLNKFKQIGSFNTSYIGYGYEDYDMFSQVQSHGIKINSNISAVHMWHPPNKQNLKHNKELFEKKGLTKYDILGKVKEMYTTLPATNR